MKSLTQVLALIAALTVCSVVDASQTCYRNGYSTHYCSDCCCDDGYGCCSCSTLAGWAIALIVIVIFVLIAVAIGIGVRRRRVYLATRQTVVYTTGAPVQTVTQYAY